MDGNQNYMPLARKKGPWLLVSFIISLVFLAGAAGFGVWAFMERQDYKFNSDQKAAEAVEVAIQQQREEDDARFAEEEKYPLRSYSGPSQFGSVRLEYPKTWSGYVINATTGNTPVSWFMHPNVVPDTGNPDNVFALRVEVSNTAYDRTLDGYQDDAENGKVTIKPYKLPKMQDVIGSRIDGEIDREKQGSVILMPLRNMTLKIWTESPDYISDFDNIILPTVTFSP